MSTSLRHATRSALGRGQHGLSIVELMVGITIGLFILAAASLVLTTQLGDNRRLLLEAQLQQDMRAAADLIARDIRRAGYWAQSWRQVWPDPPPAAAPMANPYAVMTPASAAGGVTQVVYDRSTDEEGNLIGTDDNAVDLAPNRTREQVGYRLGPNQTIDFLADAATWQALTDPAVMRVTQFNIVVNTRDLPIPCGVQCLVGPGGGCLVQRIRDVTVTIVAQAVHEPTLQRTLQDNIRLRNDLVVETAGACP